MEEHSLIQFCPGCLQDVIDGSINFTEPVCITEVTTPECDNLEVNGKIRYEEVVKARGKVTLEN